MFIYSVCVVGCLALQLLLQHGELLTLFLSQHGVESGRVLLALRQQLLRHYNRDLLDKWVVSQQVRLRVEDVDSLVQR